MNIGHFQIRGALGALLVVAGTATASAQNWMTNGLVAHYPMHGDAGDVSGHGMGGMMSGAPMMTTNRFGEPGGALAFSGGMDGILLSNLDVNLTTNGQNTVCLWMRWDGGVDGRTNPVAMPFGWGDTMEFSSMMMGWQFQMQSLTDLVHWTNSANPFMPGADMTTQMMDTAGPRMFWRLQAQP